jgi:hypothetical protein
MFNLDEFIKNNNVTTTRLHGDSKKTIIKEYLLKNKDSKIIIIDYKNTTARGVKTIFYYIKNNTLNSKEYNASNAAVMIDAIKKYDSKTIIKEYKDIKNN